MDVLVCYFLNPTTDHHGSVDNPSPSNQPIMNYAMNFPRPRQLAWCAYEACCLNGEVSLV